MTPVGRKEPGIIEIRDTTPERAREVAQGMNTSIVHHETAERYNEESQESNKETPGKSSRRVTRPRGERE